MVKVYEWKMVPVQEMHTASVDGWERDSGPVLDALHFACLMRREVVPGRVTSPAAREHVTGTEDGLGEQSDPLRNCWTCAHAADNTTICHAELTNERRVWTQSGTHAPDASSLLACLPDADGCPAWAPKATP
jgi:hypothetical protein